MNTNLDTELCRKYPHVFADRRASMQTTAMCWGFECGDGWYQLLDKTAAELELLIVGYINTHPQERNPFPWFMLHGWTSVKWAACHPLVAIRVCMKWVKVGLGLQMAEPWWPRASQVKEKYGALCFYITSGTREMYAIVDKAGSQSLMTCENCGKKGKARGREWIYTRCVTCWKKKQNEA